MNASILMDGYLFLRVKQIKLNLCMSIAFVPMYSITAVLYFDISPLYTIPSTWKI